MLQANFLSRTVITVSAFAGKYDICPKDSPAAFFTFQLSDCILQISKRNIWCLQYIFQLSTHQVRASTGTQSHEAPIAGPSALAATSPLQVLDQFYTHSYKDTVSLKRLSKQLGVRSR